MTVAARTGRLAALAAALAVGLSLASCGGSTTTSSTSTASPPAPSAPQQNANGNGSYLGRPSNGLVYVEWTASGSSLTGSLHEDLVQQASDGTETVNTTDEPFTGSLNGESLTLALTSGARNIAGTLSGGSLELDYPGQDGSLLVLQMHPASASDYDAALSSLRDHVAAVNAIAQQQQAQSSSSSSSSSAAQATAQQVQQDATAVNSGLSQLASDTEHDATNDEASLYASGLTQERADLAQTHHDMSHVLNEVGGTDSGTLCADASTVAADVSTVQADVSTVQADQSSAQADLLSLAYDIGQLRQADAPLESDRANSPGDVPGNAASEADVQDAIKSAQDTEGQINGASTTALSTAQNLLGQAKSYQQQSDAACNAANG